MQYYILLPGDTEKDCINDCNQLGESSFKSFYPGQGLTVLMKIVNTKPELLPSVRIKTEKNTTLTVEEFLKEIDTLIIRNR